MIDIAQTHVPDALIFGPVQSRRFGKSLGISFSLPAHRSCAWHCPYCQLGHLQQGGEEHWVDRERLAQALEDYELTQEIDIITCSGAGENLDHPQAADCLQLVNAFAMRHKKPWSILSNGDALQRSDVYAAIQSMDVQFYVKWDCAVRDGAWRSFSQAERQRRLEILKSLRPLRIQSMFFLRDQNCDAFQQAVQRWVAEIAALQPDSIDMVTLERAVTTDSRTAARLSALPTDLMRGIRKSLDALCDAEVRLWI